MKLRLFQIIITFLFITTGLYSQIITIDSARKVDTGTVVTVRGVISMSGELGPPLVYFQDPTAGLVAYDVPFQTGTNYGDSVQVTGKMTEYSGLRELQPVNNFSILAT